MPVKPVLLAILLTCSVAVTACAGSSHKPDPPVPDTRPRVEVTTALGTLRGVSEEGVFSFLGVPYAGPLTGLDRFTPPRDPLPYQGVNFARSGDPSSSGLPEWPEYDEQERLTMVFDRESEVVSDPGRSIRLLWDEEYAR